MSSEEFAAIITEHYPGVDVNLCQHLSMFLNAEQRLDFLDFSGIETGMED